VLITSRREIVAYFCLFAHLAKQAAAAGMEGARALRINLGYHQRMLANYTSTQQNYARVLIIRQKILGDDHWAVTAGRDP
jgi:hypothetical protein